MLLASFGTAIVSAAVGFLGGTILIAFMAQFMSQATLVPVHAFNQLWANASRAYFLFEHVEWRIVRRYVLGTVLGSVLVGFYALSFPEHYYNIFLGVMVLSMALVPKEKWAWIGRVRGAGYIDKWIFTGFFASSIGLFVGAVGVFLGAVFLTENFEKRRMIATQAVCQVVVHLAKIVVFVYLGFKILPWLPLIVLMTVVSTAGSFVGTRILEKIPQELFLRIFKGLIVILALRLVWVGGLGFLQ